MDKKTFKKGPSPSNPPPYPTTNVQIKPSVPVPLMSLTPNISLENAKRAQEPMSPPRKLSRKRGVPSSLLDIFAEPQDNWQKYFIIAKKEGDFSKISPFLYCTLITNAIGKPKSVRKMPSGSLHIEAENNEQARLLISLEKLGEHEVLVQPNMRLNTSKGVIVCRDFMVCSEEEIKNGLADQGVLEVRRINRRLNGTMQATAALVLTFDRPKPPEKIEACFYNLKVRPYIPSPMRCFKCYRFGHTSLRCRSMEQMCVCGKTAHEDTPCQDPPICVNCNEEHNAKSPACTVFEEEKEIQRVKTLQNMSYTEARKIVKSKSYTKPQASYAAVAKNAVKRIERTGWQGMLYQKSTVPSTPKFEEKSKATVKPSSPKKEAAPPIPSPHTKEEGSNNLLFSRAQIASNLDPTPHSQHSIKQFRAPEGITPIRFPARSPNKRELRSREKRLNLGPPPQPVRAPLIEGSSREEGGSDTDSECSNRTVLHEHRANPDKPNRKKKKSGRTTKSRNPGATTA